MVSGIINFFFCVLTKSDRFSRYVSAFQIEIFIWQYYKDVLKKGKDLVTNTFPGIYLLFNIVAAKTFMSEDPKTKLLLELITKEVVMPTNHPEPTSSFSTSGLNLINFSAIHA